jgi:hypothetical protein
VSLYTDEWVAFFGRSFYKDGGIIFSWAGALGAGEFEYIDTLL